VRTASVWLRQLGYNPESLTWRDPYSAGFRDAVRAFQADATLKVDGWMGPKTWKALEAFVTFDEPVDIDPYLVDRPGTSLREPCVALKRAMLLRFNVLDHHELLPYHQMPASQLDSALRQATVSLGQFLTAMEVEDAGSLTPQEALAWLSDHDRQVRVLASYLARPHAGEKPVLEDKALRTHVMAIARVELWMQDHDIGKLDQTRPGKLFWKALDDNRARWGLAPRPRKRRIDAELVSKWVEDQAAEASPSALAEEVSQAKLQKAVEQLPPALLAGAWQRTTQHRHSLWDGIRRAGRWLGRLIRRGVQAIVKGIKEAATGLTRLVRWLFRAGSRVLAAVHAAAQSLVRVLSGPLRSEVGTSRLHMDMDMDTHVAEVVRATEHSTFVAHTLRGFVVAVRILAVIVALVASALAGAWSWLTVVKRLAALVKDLHDFGLDLASLNGDVALATSTTY
jgi:hypothetical protein